MIIWNGMDLIGLVLLGLFLVVVLAFKVIDLAERFMSWAKRGFCRHKWTLHRTNSVGREAWYRCDKCKEEQLR